MKKILFSLIAMFAITAVASASNYSINNDAIDAAIESAVEISPISLDVPAMAAASASSSASVSSGKSDGVAVVLTFFLGGFGIHRHYMGTSNWMWAAYTFTFGGIFGIVPLVDFIIEIIGLIDGTGFSQFWGNPKFFAWA